MRQFYEQDFVEEDTAQNVSLYIIFQRLKKKDIVHRDFNPKKMEFAMFAKGN